MEQKTLLSLAEFFAMPGDGIDYELVHGELVQMPPQPYIHDFVKNRIQELLVLYLNGNRLGRVFVETGSVLDEGSWRQPDVSYFRKEKLAAQDPNKPIHGAADICIEVVSPSNTHRELDERARHFLATGAQTVWIVYPATKEVQVRTAAGSNWLGPDDELTHPGLLPGFSARVNDLFEAH
ncbi:MAG: Uma2 family endonuclease [Bryobacterales bacterium]|nr:Uma2 family endonuclease [Bryobacterales bacterium]